MTTCTWRPSHGVLSSRGRRRGHHRVSRFCYRLLSLQYSQKSAFFDLCSVKRFLFPLKYDSVHCQFTQNEIQTKTCIVTDTRSRGRKKTPHKLFSVRMLRSKHLYLSTRVVRFFSRAKQSKARFLWGRVASPFWQVGTKRLNSLNMIL